MPRTRNAPRATGTGRHQPMEVDPAVSSDFERRTVFGRDVLVHSSDPQDMDIEVPDTLQVQEVDLDIKNNTKAHHTAAYDIADGTLREDLIVRRGQAFNVNVTFSKEFNPSEDDLRLIFEFGPCPLESSGTHVEIILSDKDVKNEWCAWIESKTGKVTSMQIVMPPTAYVGRWHLSFDIIKRKDANTIIYRYKHEHPIYNLFNPWCKDDSVYMPDDDKEPDEDGSLLGEYVMNQTGKIYSGSSRRISPKPWSFGQFESVVLDCIINLLDMAMNDTKRGDPIMVTRRLSALVNAPNDDGILVGNWSGDYAGGRSPLDWLGSDEIIEEYFNTNEPVMYGQCWVFSGVLTTACRTLGIPARSVTNFASAHDTDGSITIDKHFDKEGETIDHLNHDSCWNFHVWNDVWMARPDLPTGYGGWQAIDATPQEESTLGFRQSYCMGPMSLRAIKEGKVHLPYDGPFVFAEVNADRVYWKKNKETGKEEIIDIRKNSVGKYLSTKKVKGVTFERTWRERMTCSDDDWENMTDQYKFKEESEEERAAVREASMHTSNCCGVYDDVVKDVEFKVSTNPDTFVGDEIKVDVVVKNTSDSVRTVTGTLLIGSTYYTGVPCKEIRREKFNKVEVKAKEERKFEYVVSTEDYLDKLTDHFMTTLSSVCIINETRQHFVDQEELRLRKPHLTVTAPDKARTEKSFNVDVSFVNPLPIKLTKCELVLMGPGLTRPMHIKQPLGVEPKAEFTASVELTPVKFGQLEIAVSFNSHEISAVTGTHSVNVEF